MEEVVVDEEKSKAIHGIRARFSGATWFEYLQDRTILVLGVGGIGSWVAFCLDRIGCDTIIYDDDMVELHNVGGQMYGPGHVGSSKVDALEAVCTLLTGVARSNISSYQERYVEHSYGNDIVIAAFDNMAARKLAFEKWAARPDRQIFIDGRLLAEDYQIYAVVEGREDEYRKTLFSDDEIKKELCTLKSTTHCSLGIASDIVSILANYAANIASMREYGIEMRDVPFSISKSLPLFDYRVTLATDGSSTTGDGTTTATIGAGAPAGSTLQEASN